MKYIKVITLSLSLVILSVLAFVGVANASNFKSGDTITVAANETINSMLFAAGNNIDIAGTVNGDVYCAGQTITISGTVNGDVFCGGRTIVVSGKVDGSVRLGGQTVTLSGTIGNSATIGAQDLVIDKNAVISRDLLGGSQNVTIGGVIGRDIVSGSQNLTINGKVGRNIDGGVQTLTVGSTGRVGGNVKYISATDLTVSTGGKIAGTVTRTAPKNNQTSTVAPMALALGWFIYVFFAALALALILVALFPRVLIEVSAKAIKAPGQTTLIGIAGMVLIPMSIVILMFTGIGIPTAILTLFAWFIIMIVSGPFAGYMLGRLLLPKSKQPVWIMLLGSAILIVTYFIPFIGCLTMLAAYIFGTGMILTQGKQLLLRPSTKKS